MRHSMVPTRSRASGRRQPVDAHRRAPRSAQRSRNREISVGSRATRRSDVFSGSRLSSLNFQPRAAATLSEVLVSLLLMGIGVVTVATLIPASVLRTLQATQLTNATVLRYDTEAQVDLMPFLVHNPDQGDDPNVPPNAPVPNAGTVEHFGKNYIVDPLGWWITQDESGLPAAGTFGVLPRYNGFSQRNVAPPAFLTERYAEATVTLPDSWTFQVEDVPTAATLTGAGPWSVTMPANVDLTSVTAGAGDSRVVLFDVTGRFSQVRDITSVNTGTNVVEFDRPVAAGFQLGQVRIESRVRRYTWLLAVRNRGGGRAAVDVVVFFNRSFSPEDEQVVTEDANSNGVLDGSEDLNGNGALDPRFLRLGADGQPGAAGVDDDGDGNVDVLPTGQRDSKEIGWVGTDDREIIVTWSTDKPFYRKGSFVFDARNAYWYRIQDVRDETATAATLVLDRPIIADSVAGAIFMRGVIEVFPIGTKSL